MLCSDRCFLCTTKEKDRKVTSLRRCCLARNLSVKSRSQTRLSTTVLRLWKPVYGWLPCARVCGRLSVIAFVMSGRSRSNLHTREALSSQRRIVAMVRSLLTSYSSSRKDWRENSTGITPFVVVLLSPCVVMTGVGRSCRLVRGGTCCWRSKSNMPTGNLSC